MKVEAQGPPWYREPLVWLLILFPATAVVSGFATLWLAIGSDDGLVEDDYYRRGKEINRVLSRDRAAQRYGLESTLALDSARDELRMDLAASGLKTLPARVELRFLHATRAGLDRIVSLERAPDGAYRGRLPELAPGRWHLLLSADDWRLAGSMRLPDETRVRIVAAPAGS